PRGGPWGEPVAGSPQFNRYEAGGDTSSDQPRALVPAEGGTRTPTGCPTRPSNVRVCQFRHFGPSEDEREVYLSRVTRQVAATGADADRARLGCPPRAGCTRAR